jgi:leucyl-tRNA synthetase
MLKAVEANGADVTRCSLLLAAEDMNDPDWRAEALRDVRAKLEAFHLAVNDIIRVKGSSAESHLERWLLSRLQSRLRRVEEAISIMKNRTALENAFFETWNDFRWYLRRRETPNAEVLREALSIWIRMLTPFIPHLCEEIWENMHGSGYVVEAPWPSYDPQKVDAEAEEAEKMVRDTIDDTLNLLKAMKIKPHKVYYYVASDWKWRVYLKALEKAEAGRLEVGELIKELLSDSSLKTRAKEVSSFAGKVAVQTSRTPPDQRKLRLQLKKTNELDVMKDAQKLFSQQFNVEVFVYSEDDPERHDPEGRSPLAQPYRPAIFIE